MNEKIQELCQSLDDLSDAIISGWSDNRNLNEAFGWHHPVIDRYDLAKIPTRISKQLKELNIIDVEDEILSDIEEIPNRIEYLRSRTLPYFFNGHGQNAIPAFLTTMEWIKAVVEPLIGWKTLNNSKAMPNKIATRLNSINDQLNEIVPEKEKLEKQIKLINDATEAAESLPTDLQNLKNARKSISIISTETTELLSTIKSNAKTAKENLDSIVQQESEASNLVGKCEEAYRITTTKGLAAAFDQRAKKSSNSMWIWVLGLLLALFAAVFIGTNRFEVLSKSLQATEPQWGIIWMNMFVSLMSLAAPIWFAWIATKQIGQRFKLAEDYHYKASVAKAYEGYRKEASRLDDKLEKRLFDSALSRLEEAPLRLMDKNNHGSPFHEFFNSPQFARALDKFPELKDKLIEVTGNINLPNKNKTKEKLTEEVEKI